MKTSSLELMLDSRAFLGEGPAWDSAHQCLYWVDIHAGLLHSFDPLEKRDDVYNVGQVLGCVAPTSSNGLILGLKDGFSKFDPSTRQLTFILKPEPDYPGNRFNDGKCSPDGRFIAGTVDEAELAASGSLYSLGKAGDVKILLRGLRISNGLTWSPDYQTFYFIDTPTRQVLAFDYDLAEGNIENPRTVVAIPESMGWPDGMTSDEHGNLWIALWGGAAVSIWKPSDGSLLEKITLPAKNVTACCFGGANLDEVYITSARKGLSTQELVEYPLSGGLFCLKRGVAGIPTFTYDDRLVDE